MNADELWIETGAMLSRAQREEVEPSQARERFHIWLQRKAAGQSPEDMSIETVCALGKHGEDLPMPAKYAKLLGLKRGAHYSSVFEAIHFYESECRKAEGSGASQ